METKHSEKKSGAKVPLTMKDSDGKEMYLLQNRTYFEMRNERDVDSEATMSTAAFDVVTKKDCEQSRPKKHNSEEWVVLSPLKGEQQQQQATNQAPIPAATKSPAQTAS